MKKTLLAAALLAATSYATAASNVTLYGVLDAGVTVSKLHGDSTKVQMSNGNWMGNRWGIKGSEDLGNGNSVFFKLEQGFKLSNGNEASEGKAFSREAALGLSGTWGTVASAILQHRKSPFFPCYIWKIMGHFGGSAYSGQQLGCSL